MSSDMEASRPADGLDPEIITAAVLEIDGVIDIYPPAHLLATASRVVDTLLTGRPNQVSSVIVSTDNTRHTVSARIGVHRHTPTPRTAARVADALLEHVPDGHDMRVDVQICRIV